MPINAVYKNNKLVPLCNIKRFNLILQPTFSISICFNLIQQPTFCKDVLPSLQEQLWGFHFLTVFLLGGRGGVWFIPPSLLLLNFPKMYIWMNIPEKSFWYCKDLSSWVRFVGSKVCPILNSTSIHVLHIVGLHSIKPIFWAYNMQKANVDFAKVDQFSTPSFKNDEISKKIMTSLKIFMSNGS